MTVNIILLLGNFILLRFILQFDRSDGKRKEELDKKEIIIEYVGQFGQLTFFLYFFELNVLNGLHRFCSVKSSSVETSNEEDDGIEDRVDRPFDEQPIERTNEKPL